MRTPNAAARYALLLREYPKFPLEADALYYMALAQKGAGQTAALRKTALKVRDKYWNHLVAPDVPMREKGSRIQMLLT